MVKMDVSALVRRGEYREALKLLGQWLQRHPHDDLMYRERAHVHLYFGFPQQARSDMDTVARLNAMTF